jgi:hypothetical protein
MSDSCEECGTERSDLRDGVCFRCRVRSVGFTWRGGGQYGRATFNDYTLGEMHRMQVGDAVVGKDIEPKNSRHNYA